nr:hypothetical protein [Tanacetum cinerariifolium]
MLLLLLLILSPLAVLTERCHPDDKVEIQKIKNSFSNGAQVLPYWTQDRDCCDIFDCDETTNRVTDFSLSYINLSGKIPDAIGGLTYLKSLQLHKMPSLVGEIPQSLARLKYLEYLDISWTNVSGQVPSFLSKLKSVTIINLSFNNLSGPIPSSLSTLPKLIGLDISRNQLTGSIPESFGHMVSQDTLRLILSHNMLSGEIPKSLSNLNIYGIDISRNNFSGDASILFNAENTTTIDISRNKFEFDLSKVTFPTKELVSLDISHNTIYGNIPFQILNAFELQILNVTYNRLCGKIPSPFKLRRPNNAVHGSQFRPNKRMYKAFTQKLKSAPRQPTLTNTEPPVIEPWNSDSDDVTPVKARENVFVESDDDDPSKSRPATGPTHLTNVIKRNSIPNNDFYHEPFIFKESQTCEIWLPPRSPHGSETTTCQMASNPYRFTYILLVCAHVIRIFIQLKIHGCYCPKYKQYDYQVDSPDRETYYFNFHKLVACLMLSNMSPDLQRTLEKYNAYDMLKELKTTFEKQVKHELFETVKAFHACKQEEGQSASSYLLKMKSYLDTMERLGYAMPNELGVSLILNSLNKDYDQFIQNYNMHSMGKTIANLHAMLKIHEKGIPKKAETPVVLAMREGKIQKDRKKSQGEKGNDKGKNKLAYAAKPKIPLPPKREHPTKDSVCHHCKEVGCGTHICNTLKGLRESRKLKHRALSLYVGNEMRAAIEAIGSFDLILPSGLIIVLDNCHFAPSITRVLFQFPDGIYEIDMHNLYPNVSSMFNVSSKRVKYSLDSSHLCHCRLGHINKKRMDKLQRNRVLQLTHDESLEKCKSCIFGKMAHKSFPHQVKRAKDILGLIHTDVCGPFRNVSREGASYFITFTDDFSRYGYVYLMKHKHEVFETFKVFQNEVENQLGKNIKAIRSNLRGEYLSHEFVNHMKSCGIVSQLTPPYKPQHNRVSERRTQTLLDMVRSMMNITTLPKSFWGYALESAVRILNMVPTKKVERTPYDLWHKKAPKVVAWNAKFFENNLMVQEASGIHGPLESSRSDEGLKLIQEEDTQPSENISEEHNEVAPIVVEPQNVKVPIRRSKRIPKAPDRYVLVKLPPNARTVRSKWLFKKKTDMDGYVYTFKARLVAKVYNQTYSVYYGETFSPVADIRAIRILLAITAFYDYEIWQMDVKTAFLNGHLSEDVYMVQPEGFVDPKHPNREKQHTSLESRSYEIDLRGSIMYAVRCTRHDVAFAQNSCSRFQQNPGEIQWTAVKTILKYIRNTKDMVLMYWAKPEAELKMRKFIDGLGNLMPSNKRPMEMLCENEPPIAIANDPKILKGARHFQRKCHYIREVIQECEIVLKKVHTYDNVADPFTKPVPFNKHFEHAMAIGIVPASSLM